MSADCQGEAWCTVGVHQVLHGSQVVNSGISRGQSVPNTTLLTVTSFPPVLFMLESVSASPGFLQAVVDVVSLWLMSPASPPARVFPLRSLDISQHATFCVSRYS